MKYLILVALLLVGCTSDNDLAKQCQIDNLGNVKYAQAVCQDHNGWAFLWPHLNQVKCNDGTLITYELKNINDYPIIHDE